MEKKATRIFLLGFMGCGKSYWGKRVAANLDLKWIDLDDYIEQKAGQTIREIFKTKGETAFRLLEQEAVKEVAHLDNVVISLGGGAPCFFENMELINQAGNSFYLQTDTATLVNRLLSEKAKRPLLAQLSDKALFDFIEKKVSERNIFYKKATFTIQTNEEDVLLFIQNSIQKGY